MRYTRLAVGILVLIAVLTSSFGFAGAQDGKVLVGISGPGDVPTLDPALATDTQSHQIGVATYVGLTTQNEVTSELEPGMATSWEVSDDGLTYTFSLLEGVPWVRYDAEAGQVVEVTDESGNVRFVTAHDFEYGMKRLLDPNTAADYAYVTAEWVAGAAAFNAGEGSADDVQITALDDYTLQIVASQAAGFVPAIFGLWFNSAQPQWAIEEFGDLWIEVENFQSYGPFTVSEWKHDESITMVRNPFWPGTDAVPVANLDAITLLMLDDAAALAEWEAGNVDVAAVPLADIDRVKVEYANEYFSGPQLCTYYYGFNVEKEPVNNIHMRRALSYGLDRQSLIDNVLKGDQSPARWFSRPGLGAAPTRDTNPDLGIGFDAEAGQAELQAYLDEMGFSDVSEIPTVSIMHNESEAHARIAEAIQQMWADNLGLDVQIATQEWAVYLETLNEDPPQIWRLGWCADYPDAHNFLSDVFLSTSGNNHTNWGNAEFDAIMEEAKVLTDLDARRELYARAEEILVYEEAAMIPIYWYTTVSVTHDNVERTYSVSGTQRYEKWDLK